MHRISILWLITLSCCLSSCASLSSARRHAPAPSLAPGAVYRDPQGRFELTVPHPGLHKIEGERGVSLETKNGSRGYSVQLYNRPRDAKTDQQALDVVLRTRLDATSGKGQRYHYRIEHTERMNRHGHQALTVHFVLLPITGWGVRTYVCQLIAADAAVYWLHCSIIRTSTFGRINRKFVKEAQRFFDHVRLAHEPAAPATSSRRAAPVSSGDPRPSRQRHHQSALP